MKNTFKMITSAAVLAATATTAFAGNPEGVLNNQVEEPVIVDDGQDWRLIAGVAALAILAGVAVSSGSNGSSSSTTTGSGS